MFTTTPVSSISSSTVLKPSSQTQPSASPSRLAEAITMVSCAQAVGEPKVMPFSRATAQSQLVFPKDSLADLGEKMLKEGKIPPPPGSLRYQKSYAAEGRKLGLRGGMNRDEEARKESLRKEYEDNQRWLQQQAEIQKRQEEAQREARKQEEQARRREKEEQARAEAQKLLERYGFM
jgi:hypothetical protein